MCFYYKLTYLLTYLLILSISLFVTLVSHMKMADLVVFGALEPHVSMENTQ